jgi:hypothetical protein
VSILQNEADVVAKRKNVLKDDPSKDLKVTASLRDQQLDKLTAKLEELGYGEKISELWTVSNTDRSTWLERQNAYLLEIDEFIEPIYKPALDWSSNFHLPTILTVCKTYHGRMLAALWGVDPPFICRSRTAANQDRAGLIEDLMRYTLRDWANDYDGVEEELDKWIWDWITKGDGFLKARWTKRFTRFQDVETQHIEKIELQMDPETGNSVPVPVLEEIEREVTVTEEVYNGPELARVPVEDIIVVGGEGDPQKADYVLQQCWLTASELWSAADQKIFRKNVVEEIVKGGKDSVYSNDESGNIKQSQIIQAGRSNLDGEHELDRYRIIEAYLKADVDGSGIAADVVVWIHARTRKILRSTYLRRVITSGKRPFFKISFHKRHGVEYSVGLVELLYSLGKEIDAIHNINMDIGILSSMPFGFYRPTTSSLKETALPLEPGALIPVDNPQTDIYFPNLGMRTSFGFQEQGALMTQVERLTSISDINLGIIGAQGAARTATGARALLGESSSNLNVYIARMNRGWKRALRYMFEMLQLRLPPGFQFRVIGDDGDAYWQQIESKQEICGMYDFELDANSANSNKQVEIERANMIYQLTSNPIDLQLGIVTPSNRYEALLNQLKVNGLKAVAKYITKPQNHLIALSPIEMADRLLNGIDINLNPALDLQGFVEVVKHIFETDELSGQFSPSHMAVLKGKAQEAVAMLEAVQAQQANANVAMQQNMNTQASMVPGNMQQPNITQAPGPGEGG